VKRAVKEQQTAQIDAVRRGSANCGIHASLNLGWMSHTAGDRPQTGLYRPALGEPDQLLAI
jgi:hypothetical protein